MVRLVASALLMTVAFLPWLGAVPVFVCLVPVMIQSMKVTGWKRRFSWGVLWGVLIFSLNFYWAVHTMHTYGRMNYPLSIALFIPLAVVQTLPFSGWFTLFPPLMKRHPLLPVLAFPLLVRLVPMIFPYTLASALSVNPILAQTASIWGEWGLDAIIVGVNLLVWQSITQTVRRYRVWTAASVMLLILVGSLSYVRSEDSTSVVSTAVVQPCVRDGDPPAVKNQAFFGSVRSARGKVDGMLVIVPESSLPDGVVGRSDFFDVVEEIRRTLNARGLLVNAVVYRNNRLTNSQFLMTQDGTLDQYDKHRLMLFGERFPLYSLFRKLPIYAANFANFSPGDDVRPMKGDGMCFATPICLEAIFEDYVAELSREAGMIVNPTDDEWFGTFHATWLHFSQVRLKAVENRRWLVRAGNTGYTVVVDHMGRIRKDIPFDRPGLMIMDIPQLFRVTIYQRIAGILPWIFGFSFLLLFFGGPRWRKQS